MKGFIEIEDVLIKESHDFSMDCLAFDIDGVLIDVTESFRKAIIETVQFYFTKVLKVPGNCQLLTLWDTKSFKNAGGFNNDWDLTKAAVLFFLSKLVVAKKRDLSVCKYKGVSLFEFLRHVSAQGGGLEAAKEAALENLSSVKKRELLGLYNPMYVRKVFQELYGGSDYCKRLYGFNPTFAKQKGYINNEKVLIDVEIFNEFDNQAILTGRTMEETDIALENIGIDTAIKRDNIIFDPGRGPTKPDEKLLVDLTTKMDVTDGIYIGDTVDDAMLVVNYNATMRGRFSFAAVTGRPDTFYGKTDIIADDVNKILRYLKRYKNIKNKAG